MAEHQQALTAPSPSSLFRSDIFPSSWRSFPILSGRRLGCRDEGGQGKGEADDQTGARRGSAAAGTGERVPPQRRCPAPAGESEHGGVRAAEAAAAAAAAAVSSGDNDTSTSTSSEEPIRSSAWMRWILTLSRPVLFGAFCRQFSAPRFQLPL